MLEYEVFSQRLSAHGSVATTKCAEIPLDTNLDGREDAFNPAELLLAALSACMLKSIERVAPLLKFDFRGVAVRIHGWRQDAPPQMARIEYTVWVDSDEADRRLELLHENLKKYGTVFNTLAQGCELTGTLRRGLPDQP